MKYYLILQQLSEKYLPNKRETGEYRRAILEGYDSTLVRNSGLTIPYNFRPETFYNDTLYPMEVE